MNAILYLYRRKFVNSVKKALRKPVTYVYLAFILFYLLMVPWSFRMLFEEWSMASPGGMAAVFTVFAFWIIPANLTAYAKRKGLLYRSSDIHFLFPSPISPKKVLLYAHLKNLLLTFFLNILLTIGGAYIFKVEIWRMILYFIFSTVIENLLESGIMLLLYGSERIGERTRALVIKGAYLLIGIFVVMGVYTYIVYGLSLQSVLGFLHSDMVQMVPVVGWYIAVIHLLFMGPTTVNVICSLLYLLMFVLVVFGALRMKCSGEYYEDAIKFADDYEELLANRRAGNAEARLGKKQKYGRASVAYCGSGAKALFYRQLLEYKKNRYFIFDMNTVFSLGATAIISYLYLSGDGFGMMKEFVVPGAMAYLIFILTAYTGKWGKELKSPYTFLIPDNPFAKLWYATVIQHIQAFVNGCLFAIPCSLIMGLSPITIVLSVVCYVALNACKLYSITLSEIAVGNALGKTGKQLFQLFLLGLVIGAAAIGALLGMVLWGINGAYLLMSFLVVAATVIFMTISSLSFYRMETVE